MIEVEKKRTLKKLKKWRNKMIIKCDQNLMFQKKFSKRLGSGFTGRIQPKKSRKTFPCKTISSPDELMRLGYLPSTNTMIPQNDYDVLKKVA
tara:strand:+ start:365 stop:640 length:276 start_codon:yes stop_codon:yes gene_type:complete